MAKAKTIKTTDSPFQMLSIELLSPSPTNPRKRFHEVSISELAESIKEQGILEPLIVRQITVKNKPGQYEIVCGERRYRAANHAGLSTIPALVRELTDEQVLDIQIHENLHREDIHPMDEATGYQALMNHLKCDINEVALRVGKLPSYVASRLKLNQLIPEAQQDLENGHLMLSHALEIAKFGQDSQADILHKAYKQRHVKWDEKLRENIYEPDKTALKPLVEFQDWILENIRFRLNKAPFDTKSTNLRPDGLACGNCPNRSGANALLFDNNEFSKTDSCLDPACWGKKAIVSVNNKLAQLAEKQSLEVKDLPVVISDSWHSEQTSDGIVLGKDDFKEIHLAAKGDPVTGHWASTNTCESMVTTIDVSEPRYGKTMLICSDRENCRIHFPHKPSSSVTKPVDQEAIAEAEREKRAQRKEELFDVKVGEAVRKMVLRLAAEQFADTLNITGGGANFTLELLLAFWLRSGMEDSDFRYTFNQVIKPTMESVLDSDELSKLSRYIGLAETALDSKAGEVLGKLSQRKQHILLFLFVHGMKGAMYYDHWKSQKEILAMAETYSIDYRELDAIARLDVVSDTKSMKKHEDLFKVYLDSVRAGDKEARSPRVYSESWEPKN